MAVDLDLALKAAQDAFAIPVDYTPRGGVQLDGIRGNFRNQEIEVAAGEEAGHRARQPMLGVRLVEFPADKQPRPGDSVVINTVAYNVVDTDDDGQGHAWLILHLV